MTDVARPVDELNVEDFRRHPVWRFTDRDGEEHDETLVAPVTQLPTSSLDGSIVGVQVHLAKGQRILALISGVDTTNPRVTEQFLTIAFQREGRRFHLARHFDFDFEERSPDRAAAFLELSVDEVFPIRYDLTALAVGDVASLRGEIPKEPRERLSMEEQFALMFP